MVLPLMSVEVKSGPVLPFGICANVEPATRTDATKSKNFIHNLF